MFSFLFKKGPEKTDRWAADGYYLLTQLEAHFRACPVETEIPTVELRSLESQIRAIADRARTKHPE